MYPQSNSSLAQPPTGNYILGPDGPDVPRQLPQGIASRVQELQQVVQATRELGAQLKNALGITQNKAEGQSTQPPATLAELITELRDRLECANRDFRDTLEHLNS